MRDLVTLCFTIGKRPDLLRLTLASLGDLRHLPALAINDFGDQETSAVFAELCPHGRIVGPQHHLGHHRAVDALYAEVNTPFIFHNEDDWSFERTDFLPDAMRLLTAEPALTQVCFRDSLDIPMENEARRQTVIETRDGIRYQRLDGTHPQWHGFTFNPHLIRKEEWERIGGYAPFAKERHLSRKLRKQGRYTGFLLPAACRHIGDQRCTVPPKVTVVKRLKNWLRARA